MQMAKFTLMVAAMTLWAHTVSAEIMTWKVGDDTRSAIVYPPARNSAGEKAPLIYSAVDVERANSFRSLAT